MKRASTYNHVPTLFDIRVKFKQLCSDALLARRFPSHEAQMRALSRNHREHSAFIRTSSHKNKIRSLSSINEKGTVTLGRTIILTHRKRTSQPSLCLRPWSLGCCRFWAKDRQLPNVRMEACNFAGCVPRGDREAQPRLSMTQNSLPHALTLPAHTPSHTC